MAIVISSLVFTKRDIGGNPWTEGYFLIEFRDTGYTPGGENMSSLGTYMKRIEYIVANPSSGANAFTPAPQWADFPAPPGSARMELRYAASTLIPLLISGLPITIVSGTQGLLSGQLLSGNISGQVFFTAFSGTVAGSGVGRVAPGSGGFSAELLSGVAVSGTRATLYVLGY